MKVLCEAVDITKLTYYNVKEHGYTLIFDWDGIPPFSLGQVITSLSIDFLIFKSEDNNITLELVRGSNEIMQGTCHIVSSQKYICLLHNHSDALHLLINAIER